jgi:hypothetical protein
MTEFWQVFEGDVEGSSVIGSYKTEEAARAACVAAYLAEQAYAEATYGPDSDYPSDHMLWKLPPTWKGDILPQELDDPMSFFGVVKREFND